MAQLEDVNVLSDREIEFEGARYVQTEGPAQFGDIVRNDMGYLFMPEGAFYLVNERLRITDDDGDIFEYDEDENTLFRRVESAPQSPSELRALIESKRAEITQLEAQLAEMETIGVGDYVRVVARTHNDEITVGNIARVVTKGGGVITAYKLREIIGDITDWVGSNSIVKLTPAEAKAALIAQVEEAFKSAE